MENLFLGTPKPKNVGEGRIAQMAAELEAANPEWMDMEIEGYTVKGKLPNSATRHLLLKDEQYFFAVIKDQSVSPMALSAPDIEIGEMNINIVNMGEIEYDPSIFIPMKSGTALDGVFSKKGGTMPATNYIIVGDPGIGKSTISIEYAAQMKKNNPDKDILFISGEMTRVDMYEYLERFELWKELPTVFVSEFTEGTYKESFEALFNQGWDFIVGDSFAEITEAVREDYNMYTRGKMSSSGAEKWFIDLMVKNNLAENEKKKHTAHLMIQQVTKGGKFVGSNKLKHNTTGMIELRYTKTDERKVVVDKNRRGTQYGNADLHFEFIEEPKEGQDPIFYDVARIEREKELLAKVNADREELLSEERKLNQLFGIESEEDDLSVVEEELN